MDDVEGKPAMNAFQVSHARNHLKKILQASRESVVKNGVPVLAGQRIDGGSGGTGQREVELPGERPLQQGEKVGSMPASGPKMKVGQQYLRASLHVFLFYPHPAPG
jgi:CRISPR/Cas system-associated exonuclease Cas4 (RecB family)